MHSILYALSQFDSKAYVVGPPEMSLLPEFKAELDAAERHATRRPPSIADVIAECDVIYMEPVVQADYTKSRDERGDASVGLTPAAYCVTRELLRDKAKPSSIILHSLPRMDELLPDVDATRHPRYWVEAFNGVVTADGAARRSCSGRWSNASRGVGDGVHAQRRAGLRRAAARTRACSSCCASEFGLCSVKDGCAPEGSCGACTVIVDGHAGRLVRAEGDARRGQARRHAGGSVRGDAPPLGRVLRRRRRVAVRLLLAGDRDEGRGAAGEASGADPRGDRARAARQPLPLHRLREDRRRDRARGGRAPRRAAPGARPQRPRRLAQRALPGRRARARRPAVRRRHDRARDAARRAALLRPPAGARAPDRHGAGEGAPRRRRRRHGRRRARRARRRDRSRSDWRQLVAAGETTAYVGDVLAVVAAETRHAAREAAALVEVEYEVLEPVTDPFDALADGAPMLHERRQRALGLARAARRRRRGARGVRARRHAARSGRSSSSTRSSSRSRRSPCPTGTAPLHVYSQGQGIWDDRRQIASFLGLPGATRCASRRSRPAAPSARRRT